ncbi:MAG TPA: hypothetical protein VED01_00915 [Burkholderiales bacterium]|nr:hypothetical protein [Burkholderiales bacterium]
MKSFVQRGEAAQTLKDLPPSSRDDIRRMAREAGLDLPEQLMNELCDAYPAFEAMVRRLPRRRPRFDEPAHVADVRRLADQG